MARRLAKAILRDPSRVLDKIKEIALSRRTLNWAYISKPLKENPCDLGNIHSPNAEDYRMKYSFGKKTKTAYDWWYSAILRDREGRLHFLILAFHPRWSFCRLIRIDADSHEKDPWSAPKLIEIEQNFIGKMGYSEHGKTVEMWVQKIGGSDPTGSGFMKCAIRNGASRLAVKTENMAMDLTFTSLGLPFWINKGREATSSPRGDTMSGFYDICSVQGSLSHKMLGTEIRGIGVNEHLMSFTPPDRFWKRVDGVFLCTDQIYCAFIYLENRTDTGQHEYKDGAVFIRETQEYLTPTDFEVRYLKLDNSKKLPTEIHLVAETTKGKLDVVARAMVEIEKQLALKVVDGIFIFTDGRELRLTNGYGQHALH